MTKLSKIIMLSAMTAFLVSGQANASDLGTNDSEGDKPDKKTVRWKESIAKIQEFDKTEAPKEVKPAENRGPGMMKSILRSEKKRDQLNESIKADQAKLKSLESMPMHATKAVPGVKGIDGRKVMKKMAPAEDREVTILRTKESILRAEESRDQLNKMIKRDRDQLAIRAPMHAKKAFDGTRAMKGKPKDNMVIDGRKRMVDGKPVMRPKAN
tara:strand:+ start:713 stop:1348 length:636 start_codon:yes stop_codon:yes gene_type:complete